MGLVNVSLPVDGTTADVADYNVPITTIVNTLNGNIDTDNVSAISSSKITKDTNDLQGWIAGQISAPNTVAYNGNRSYTLTFNSTDLTSLVLPGMRVRTTRTVTAPTQCTSLNGSTQYYSKTSPTGLTFTTTFTCSAWVKLTSYGAQSGIIARRNADTEGFSFGIRDNGRVQLIGLRIASNNKQINSYQSIPLNKWVHVAATLDMSLGDTTAQKIWIDGVEVPREYTLTGTATALVQGTTALVVGANTSAGGTPFPGKIAQAAVFSSQLSDATVKSYYSQGLSGSETNLISAYSFNNSITDLNTTNANNLTAQGSAVATNADSPFSQNASGTPGGSYDYGIVMSNTFSTNTTMVVQVPEGNTIPTSGGIAAVAFSTQKAPYGMPVLTDKWEISNIIRIMFKQTSPSSGTWYNLTSTSGTSGGNSIIIPIGNWDVRYQVTGAALCSSAATTSYAVNKVTLSTANNTESDRAWTTRVSGNNTTEISGTQSCFGKINLSAATTYYMNNQTDAATTSEIQIIGNQTALGIFVMPSTL